eukprot:955934-Amorphochlora_amoeboformis.AAC.1
MMNECAGYGRTLWTFHTSHKHSLNISRGTSNTLISITDNHGQSSNSLTIIHNHRLSPTITDTL